jgi:hypothetical protein
VRQEIPLQALKGLRKNAHVGYFRRRIIGPLTLVVSLTLHFAIFLELSSREESRIFSTEERPLKEFEISEIPEIAAPVQPVGPSSTKTNGKSASHLSMNELMPNLTSEPAETSAPAQSDAKKTSQILSDASRASTNRFVYEAIDNALDYPTEFIDRKFQGTVEATIRFSPQGEFLKNESEFKSNSRFLRLLVIKALRRAFDSPLPLAQRLQNQRASIKATFNFEISHDEDKSRFTKKVSHSVGRLVFERVHHISGPFQLERALFAEQTGQTGPMASVDLLWLADNIGDVLSGKKVDPLQKYRDDPDF